MFCQIITHIVLTLDTPSAHFAELRLFTAASLSLLHWTAVKYMARSSVSASSGCTHHTEPDINSCFKFCQRLTVPLLALVEHHYSCENAWTGLSGLCVQSVHGACGGGGRGYSVVDVLLGRANRTWQDLPFFWWSINQMVHVHFVASPRFYGSQEGTNTGSTEGLLFLWPP